jgi:hypothetical protein
MSAEESTPAMIFGQIIHCLLFEPAKWGERFAVKPVFKGRGAKMAEAAWFTEIGKRQAVPQDDHDKARRMADAVLLNPEAKALLTAPAEHERRFQWTVGRGVRVECMAKPDAKLTQAPLILDLKTMSGAPSPDHLGRACVNYGYHRQAHWYTWGAQQAEGEVFQFLWVCVSKDPPFETAVYRPKESVVALAKRQNMAKLGELVDCWLNDRWHTRWHGRQEIDLPKYGYYQP